MTKHGLLGIDVHMSGIARIQRARVGNYWPPRCPFSSSTVLWCELMRSAFVGATVIMLDQGGSARCVDGVGVSARR